MALKPEPMQRALIVASKAHQNAIIESLHELRAAHFIDFQEQKDGEFAEFRIGRPLPAGAAASERLVRVRALLRHLGLEGTYTDARISARELEATLDARLATVETDVGRAIETRESVRTTLAEGREMEAKLAPLTSLPIKLEDYSGYDSLEVHVGRADLAFRAEIARVAPDHLLVTGEGELFALFVPKARDAAVTELLYRHGYAEVEVPAGKGQAAERIREIQAERATLESRLQKSEADLARLAGEHKDLLLAAEEHLGIAVEKAEAPLAFATTDNAIIVDTWLPMGSVSAVEASITKATRGEAHFARLETSDDVAHDDAHHHDHAHGGEDSAFAAHADKPAPAPKALPPTKYDNPKTAQRFEWFTNLFSTPRYNEIDPTLVFAIFFPLFFGFMIGDLGLGLIMVLLGYLLASKLPRIDGMKQLGTALMIAGVVAALLGGLVFKDAMGIPLGVNHHLYEETLHHVAEHNAELERAAIASGQPVPTPHVATCRDMYNAMKEASWTCMFRGTDSELHADHWSDVGSIGKVTNVPTMLLISLLAGFVHLLLGLLFGIRNEWSHGGKHLAAKFGYLILLLGFFPVALAMLRPDALGAVGISVTLGYLMGGVGFLLGAVILGWAEGFGGVVEIPSMFSAIMSYLRLGAVAIAKGAMAIAFNSFTLVVALTGAGPVVLILGFIGFLFAQVVLLVLGLLSGGIQALRLNFVEFFTKFYKGGGTLYKPFGRERIHTAPSGAAGAAISAVTIKP